MLWQLLAGVSPQSRLQAEELVRLREMPLRLASLGRPGALPSVRTSPERRASARAIEPSERSMNTDGEQCRRSAEDDSEGPERTFMTPLPTGHFL